MLHLGIKFWVDISLVFSQRSLVTIIPVIRMDGDACYRCNKSTTRQQSVCSVMPFSSVWRIKHHGNLSVGGVQSMSRKQVWIWCNGFDNGRTGIHHHDVQEQLLQMTVRVILMPIPGRDDIFCWVVGRALWIIKVHGGVQKKTELFK